MKVGDLVTLSKYGARILALKHCIDQVGVIISIERDKIRDRLVYLVLFVGTDKSEMLYRKEIKHAK
tara:strand:- start:2987 stop:3184 length:198 start_codon:yes stop_codon:yes gene_type:complete